MMLIQLSYIISNRLESNYINWKGAFFETLSFGKNVSNKKHKSKQFAWDTIAQQHVTCYQAITGGFIAES